MRPSFLKSTPAACRNDLVRAKHGQDGEYRDARPVQEVSKCGGLCQSGPGGTRVVDSENGFFSNESEAHQGSVPHHCGETQRESSENDGRAAGITGRREKN